MCIRDSMLGKAESFFDLTNYNVAHLFRFTQIKTFIVSLKDISGGLLTLSLLEGQTSTVTAFLYKATFWLRNKSVAIFRQKGTLKHHK